MCLGESTTQGQYPPFLEEILNQRNTGIKFKVIDAGVAGASSAVLLTRMEDNLNNYHPDMVVVMMGINDLSGYAPYKTVSASKITQLVKTSRLYKLLRLLGLHMRAKANEIGICMPGGGSLARPEPGLSNAELIRYPEKEDSPRAEEAVREGIASNPNNDMAYVELGLFYDYEGSDRLSEAEELFKKAIEINPGNYEAYIALGWLYHYSAGNLNKAEEVFSKAMEIEQRDDRAYSGLGWTYIMQNKFYQAEEVYKKAILSVPIPNNERMYGALATLYAETGRPRLGEEYRREAGELRLGYYNPLTVNSYQKLKLALDARKIKLVCAQYPMHSVELLKRMFSDQKEVIFVDNERIFKDALKNASYKEYFTDRFAGDFGHCTPKGNRLLAQNIANAIMAEIFCK